MRLRQTPIKRIRKSKKNRQHNGQKKKGQKDKQRSTKHYTVNKRSSNTNPNNNIINMYATVECMLHFQRF
jgi:hypothetical protein